MAITDIEKSEIKNVAGFLEELGHIKTEDQYSINYSLSDICISVVYPPDSEESDVNIRFIRKNKVFSVGWIALVRENIKGSNDKLVNVKELLKYVKNHYSKIIDYQYCMESNNLVDKYVEEHCEKFENAVRDFLNQN